MQDVELTVAESSRYGAPMTLCAAARTGTLRRSSPWARFVPLIPVSPQTGVICLVRGYEEAAARGAGLRRARQLLFVIAEEGITAAAYAVITIVDRHWTIEECGDRDPSGARVGAILHALIAREPVEAGR